MGMTTIANWVRRRFDRNAATARRRGISRAASPAAVARALARWPEIGADDVETWRRGAMRTTMDFIESSWKLEDAGLSPRSDRHYFRRLALLELGLSVEEATDDSRLDRADEEVAAWTHAVDGGLTVERAAIGHARHVFATLEPEADASLRDAVFAAIDDGARTGTKRSVMQRIVGIEAEERFWREGRRA